MKANVSRSTREAALAQIKATIETKLRENDVPFVEVQGRVKRLYSLWKKLKKRKLMLKDQIFMLQRQLVPDIPA